MDPYSADDIKRRKDNYYFTGRDSEKGFKPLTGQFEISGTKFRIQFGVINGNSNKKHTSSRDTTWLSRG